MSVKTITITKDAYDSLALLKGDGESFTDVIRRLTGSQVLLSSFAGAWVGAPKERVEDIRRYLAVADRASRAKVRRLVRLVEGHGQPG